MSPLSRLMKIIQSSQFLEAGDAHGAVLDIFNNKWLLYYNLWLK